MFPKRCAIIPARTDRIMASIRATSEENRHDRIPSRNAAERVDLRAARHRDFRIRLHDRRQDDAVSSLERDRGGQERRAGDPDWCNLAGDVYYHRGGGALKKESGVRSQESE